MSCSSSQLDNGKSEELSGTLPGLLDEEVQNIAFHRVS